MAQHTVDSTMMNTIEDKESDLTISQPTDQRIYTMRTHTRFLTKRYIFLQRARNVCAPYTYRSLPCRTVYPICDPFAAKQSERKIRTKKDARYTCFLISLPALSLQLFPPYKFPLSTASVALLIYAFFGSKFIANRLSNSCLTPFFVIFIRSAAASTSLISASS